MNNQAFAQFMYDFEIPAGLGQGASLVCISNTPHSTHKDGKIIEMEEFLSCIPRLYTTPL